VFGTSARTEFESNRDDLGDTFYDFESTPSGPLSGLAGVSFKTTLNRFGTHRPLDLPVAVLPWDFVANAPKAIIGIRSGAPRYIPDGQNQYEIVFDTAQRRAGVQRNWNTFSLTRFYSGTTLLATHRNTVGNEFVGFVSDSNDSSTWITRIELDGLTTNGVYQVGMTDDLFFGSVATVPEPNSALIALVGLATCSFIRRRT
jgi:hypothetical protein